MRKRSLFLKSLFKANSFKSRLFPEIFFPCLFSSLQTSFPTANPQLQRSQVLLCVSNAFESSLMRKLFFKLEKMGLKRVSGSFSHGYDTTKPFLLRPTESFQKVSQTKGGGTMPLNLFETGRTASKTCHLLPYVHLKSIQSKIQTH